MVYIRVSTHAQKSDSQRVEITQWLTAHGHNPDNVQWFENKETGAKLDRIACSMQTGINILSKWCESGVRVVSVTQQIDLSGTVGHLVAGVLFAVAEIELQHSKERQAAGIAVAKSKGVYKGRKKGTTKAKPERARKLAEHGLKSKEIANALDVTERTVFRYLEQRY